VQRVIVTPDHAQGHIHTHTHAEGILWTRDWPVEKASTWQHKILRKDRQTSIPPAGFKPAIPACERPQTHALDCAATGMFCTHQVLFRWLSAENEISSTCETYGGEHKLSEDFTGKTFKRETAW